MQRLDRRAHALVGGGILLLEAPRDRRDLGARLILGGSGREEANDPIVADVACLGRLVRAHGHPELLRLRKVDSRLQDPDHRVGVAAQRERPPNEPAVGAEPTLPEAVGDDRRTGRAREAVLGEQGAPDGRRQTQHPEDVRRHLGRLDPLRVAAPGERDAAVVVRGHVAERAALLLEVAVIDVRETPPVLSPPLVDHADGEEPVGVAVREGAQNDGVRDAEDRGVDSDAQREAPHRHDDEPPTSDQRASRVPNIGEKGVHGPVRWWGIIDPRCAETRSGTRPSGLGTRR